MALNSMLISLGRKRSYELEPICGRTISEIVGSGISAVALVLIFGFQSTLQPNYRKATKISWRERLSVRVI